MKIALLLYLTLTVSLLSQVRDSIKTYRLEDITIKGILALEPESFINIEPKDLRKADARSVIDLGKKIPSIKVQTNSRGESLFFFRGTGERQITLFLDGTPLNIPWDNRIDLSFIPPGIIDGITILKGVPPAIFGANAISGVINFKTLDPELTSYNGNVSVQLGETGSRKFAGNFMNSTGKLSYLIAGTINNSDGFKLPSSFSNSANPGSSRLNSYLHSKNIYGKLNYKFNDEFKSGLFFSYITAEKGVPPEIGVSNPRYWQYPEWKNLIIGNTGQIDFAGDKSFLYYSLSLNLFSMQINQYKNFLFNTIDDIEKNEDDTFRFRLIYTNILTESSLLKVGVNGHVFKHREKFRSSNYAEQVYTENILSGGVEYELIKDNYVLSLGGGIDYIETPKTGDKPPKESVADYAINAAFVYSLNENVSLRLNGGRKTRFPTLRETFSGALGRFVPNPSLKAESANSGEFSISYKNSRFTTDASLFLSYLIDGIVRVSLPQRQFQRVNKDEIRTYGLEVVSKYSSGNFSSAFNITLLSARAKNKSGEFADTLEYRPGINGSLDFDYSITKELDAVLEFEYIGKEFGLKEGTTGYQSLPEYLLTNIRLAYNFEVGHSNLEIFIRLNNLFDRLYYTQFGLPEAGRQIFAGANFQF
jgi:iron complex outermembrane receptor protein